MINQPILIPHLATLDDVRIALVQGLNQLQTTIVNQGVPTDFRGAVLTNVGIPQNNNDVVTLGYLKSVLLPQVAAQTQNQLTIFNSGTLPFLGVGQGLAYAFGVLTAKVSSGIQFDGSGNITVKNGSGISIDGSGNVTVNDGVGLGIDPGTGQLIVDVGTGLSTAGGSVFIPGGAITNSLLAALAVGTANIQAGAVGATEIANAAITTAKIGAAQITTALIANAAITNALLGSAVVGTANIQNAAITTALIANLAVGNAAINDVSAIKITTGLLTVGGGGINANVTILNAANTQIGWIGVDSGNYGAWFQTCHVGGSSYSTAPLQADSSGILTITSTSGSNVVTITSGSLTATGASVLTTLSAGTITVSTVGGGAFTSITNTFFAVVDASVQTLFSISSTTDFRVRGTLTIDNNRNGTFANLSSNGSAVITSATIGSSVVTSAVAGTGIAVSGATGAVTISVSTVPIAHGGTGQTTLSGAQFGLGFTGGSSALSGGTKLISTGFTSVHAAFAIQISGAGANDYFDVQSVVGGNVTFGSNLGGSTNFYWFAFGTP